MQPIAALTTDGVQLGFTWAEGGSLCDPQAGASQHVFYRRSNTSSNMKIMPWCPLRLSESKIVIFYLEFLIPVSFSWTLKSGTYFFFFFCFGCYLFGGINWCVFISDELISQWWCCSCMFNCLFSNNAMDTCLRPLYKIYGVMKKLI